MKILVTGGSGFLGWYTATALTARGHTVVATSQDGSGLPTFVEAAALSLDDGGAAAVELVARVRPDAIVHLAAIANAERCAADEARTQAVNVDATSRLAKAATAVGAYLLLASTDLVFDGTAAPYVESDPTSPVGPYMTSKVAAERAVTETGLEHGVARIALLYGRVGGKRSSCFTEHLIAKLEAGEEVLLFDDQWRTPVYVEDAAELLADLVRVRAPGVVHLGGPERVSRVAHGLAIAAALGLDPSPCRAVPMSDLPSVLPRPADTSLTIDRLVALVGRTPLAVQAGCDALAKRSR